MKLPKFERWESVLLEWVDSAGGCDGWHKIKKKDTRIAGCTSSGMVYAQTSESVTLILSWDEVNKHADGVITIPSSAIRRFQRLR